MKEITESDALKTFARRKWIAGLVLVYGMLGFFLPFQSGQIPPSIELPLAWMGGVVVDAEGTIYCAVQLHRRIQIYDSTGEYRGALSTSSRGGPLTVAIPEPGVLQVASFDSGKLRTFDHRLRLIRTEKIDYRQYAKNHRDDEYRDANGVVYRRRLLWAGIIRIFPDGRKETVVSPPFYLHLIPSIIPSWFLFITGMILFDRATLSPAMRAYYSKVPTRWWSP